MITNIAVAVHVASTSPHVFSGAWARRVRVTHRRTRAVSEPGVRGDDCKCGDERPPACLPAYLPTYLPTYLQFSGGAAVHPRYALGHHHALRQRVILQTWQWVE